MAGSFVRLVTAAVVAVTAGVLVGYGALAGARDSVTHSGLGDAPADVVTDYNPDSGGGV